MPYKTLKEANEAIPSIKDLDGVDLDLTQINKIAEAMDAIAKASPEIKAPIAVAIANWKRGHEIKDGKWVKKTAAKSEHIGVILDASVYSLKDASEFADNHALGDVVPVQRGEKIIFFSKFEQVAELPTVDIPHVDIFQAGKWTDSKGNTTTYTAQDIEGMAADTNAVYAKKLLEGPLKIGHNAEQKLAKEDGYPAVGWLSNFVAEGGKLYADLKKVPEQLALLIKSGAYRKRSAEIIHGFKNPDGGNGKAYKHVICGLSVLGATLPAISALSDVVKLYKGTPVEDSDLSEYAISVSEHGIEIEIEEKDGDKTMTDDEKKQMEDLKSECSKLKADLKAANDDKSKMSSELEKYKGDCEKLSTKLSGFEADMATYKADMEKLQKQAQESEKKAFFSQNIKKATPADMPMFQELYDAKAAAGQEALTAFKSEFAKRPDHESLSEYGAETSGQNQEGEDANETKIEKYCKENNLDINKSSDYAAATSAVMKYEVPEKL